MTEFQFQFDPVPKKKKIKRSRLETWIPLPENALLNPAEKEAVLYGDAIEQLFLVMPAFLFVDEKKTLSYFQSNELDYYYTVAKLKKSPYLVLLGEEKKSAHMHHLLEEREAEISKHTFYLDNYFPPNFGGIKPKCLLLEKTQLTVIPNTMVLFREV